MIKFSFFSHLFIGFILVFTIGGCGKNLKNTSGEEGGLPLKRELPPLTVNSTSEDVNSVTTETSPTDNTNKKNMSQSIVILKTNYGDITLTLFSDVAPKTVENFIKLALSHFYDGVKFHRVIPGFMIQSGDPNSKDDDWGNDGRGGPGYTFADEINDKKNVFGRISMANAGPNTNGSQFFIVTANATPWLDGKHTVFGEVSIGVEVVKKIESVATNQNDHPLDDVIIENVVVE